MPQPATPRAKSGTAWIEGWIFRRGFEHIQTAYAASVAGFETDLQDAVAFVRKRWGLKDGDPVPPVTTDDEGEAVDFQDDVDNLTEQSAACLRIIRESFVSTLFHYWERQSFVWLKAPVSSGRQYDHAATMAWLTKYVGPPEDATIDKLRLVANALKHGPGRSAKSLYAGHPELFGSGSGLTHPSNAPLILDDAVIRSFFSAVDNSAPTEK